MLIADAPENLDTRPNRAYVSGVAVSGRRRTIVEKVERRLAAILSADVAGYTRLMRADEEGTFSRLRAHRTELIEPKIAEHRGRLVKLMGDGLLVEFASVIDAVRCATEIQRGMAERNSDAPKHEQIILRVGINLGDVIVEGDDIHGDGVNVATRMQEIAPPGGISVSGVVYDSVRDKLAPEFEDLGPQQVKNISEPVRAYRVVLDPEATGRRETPRDARSEAPPEAPHVNVAARVSKDARILSILGGVQRQGTWSVPKNLRVIAVMGGIDLDFREAEFGPGVTEVNVTAVMGGIAILVPPHLQVECNGTGIMGVFEGMDRGAGDRASDMPLLRISGIAVMGALEIAMRPPGERMKVDAKASIGQIGQR